VADRSLHVLLQGDPQASQQARLAATLIQRGHRVTFADAPKLAAEVRGEHGLECGLARVLRGAPRPLRGALVARRLRALGVDVIHLNYLHPSQEVFARLGPEGPPYVATAWGSDVNTEAFPKSPRWLSKLGVILRGASAVTADSHPLLERSRRLFGGGPGDTPFELVFFGVDLELFGAERARAGVAAWREQLGLASDTPVVLSARKLQPHYHTDVILEAFAASRWAERGVLLVKHHGRGAEDAHLAELKARARALGVEQRLRVAPPVPYDDLPALYALADVAVSHPAADGVPSAFFELMSVRVPIVATDLPAYDGVLEHEGAGLRVPHGDVPALAEALDRLTPGGDLAGRLVRAGARFVREHADWEVCVDRWEALYRRALT